MWMQAAGEATLESAVAQPCYEPAQVVHWQDSAYHMYASVHRCMLRHLYRHALGIYQHITGSPFIKQVPARPYLCLGNAGGDADVVLKLGKWPKSLVDQHR